MRRRILRRVHGISGLETAGPRPDPPPGMYSSGTWADHMRTATPLEYLQQQLGVSAEGLSERVEVYVEAINRALPDGWLFERGQFWVRRRGAGRTVLSVRELVETVDVLALEA